MRYIGCHLSSSAGFAAMGRTALSIGANTFQFFTRNPRGSRAKPVDPADVAAYLALAAKAGLGTILAHAPYTINPCSKDERTREFARLTLADDLRRMEYLPGNLYNFHPGSHTGQGLETGITQIADTLNAILTPAMHTTVLLETMSGKGTEVGSRFEELREILDRVTLTEQMGVCLDTCHVSDAGYDVAGDLDGVLTEFDRVVGLHRLKALHLNDSLNPVGAHKDRHARIGEGTLGAETFRRIATYCKDIGVKYLTVYAFSTENWRRPPEEVRTIMSIFDKYMREALSIMERDKFKMRFFGERSGLSPELQRLMAAAEEKSTHYDGCQMNLCINYGGRDEILHAVRRYAEAYKAGTAPELTEDVFSGYLYSAGIPDPDLIIRTSGEQRLSNFLPWQGAYSELYFTDVLWPDFTERDMDAALAEFQRRDRRFGGVK